MPSMAHHGVCLVADPLLTFLGASCSETVFVCLKHIQLLHQRDPTLFADEFEQFYIRVNEPASVQILKLQMLADMATESSAWPIIAEMSECARGRNTFVCTKAVSCIGLVAGRFQSCAGAAILVRLARALLRRSNVSLTEARIVLVLPSQRLLRLLDLQNKDTTAAIALVVTDLLRLCPLEAQEVVPYIPRIWKEVDDAEAKAAAVWLLGEHGEQLDEAPRLLHQIGSLFSSMPDTVQLQLLVAAMKLFFKRPPECRAVLGTVLKKAIEETASADVHDRATFFYQLLRHDITVVHSILFALLSSLSRSLALSLSRWPYHDCRCMR